MHLSIADSIDEVTAADWDRLAGPANPFLRHGFLAALEHTGCANARTGWRACHLLVHADGPRRGELLGIAPMYSKTHSYGEYVFDWAWADAYQRAGLRYYPKLVAAVPFTPASGPRLLVASGDQQTTVKQYLAQAAIALARESGVSSLHWLFAPAQDMDILVSLGHLRRTGYQFHWYNREYQDFDQFLAGLSSGKRKKLRRERRYVRDAGIKTEIITGDTITPRHWDLFYEFYLATIETYGAIQYLTRDFFHALSPAMGADIVLVLARVDRNYVAGALNLRGKDTLYGRYWGTKKYFNGLHFEVCYYTPMEYCIEHGLARFEAGAQGEHKLARGFLPVTTYSAHWLRHPEFGRAIADFLIREHSGVEYYMDELNERSPFKEIS